MLKQRSVFHVFLLAFYLVISIVFFLSSSLCAKPVGEEIYGSIEPKLYLTGQFDPTKHELFATVASYKIDDHGRGIYLRKEALVALSKMVDQLKKDLGPNTPFWVQSGTRNFYSQKAIWQSKWNGQVKVGGISLTTVKDPVERARRILSYSSMPSTSRHHWGTDFDINSLTVSYYKSGIGKKIYDWMLKNAPQYGFCLPYSETGRSDGYEFERGYEFEPWHWSYKPLASPLLQEWEKYYKAGLINGKDVSFLGSDSAYSLAPVYVGGVSASCR
ncbi:MAG: M15 family metallopeptidase [Leptonema sp. (in: Bacteria)]|nr:M15 family metallopeptidase [Leptonema sp. (in: bacteria)]